MFSEQERIDELVRLRTVELRRYSMTTMQFAANLIEELHAENKRMYAYIASSPCIAGIKGKTAGSCVIDKHPNHCRANTPCPSVEFLSEKGDTHD